MHTWKIGDYFTTAPISSDTNHTRIIYRILDISVDDVYFILCGVINPVVRHNLHQRTRHKSFLGKCISFDVEAYPEYLI